MNSAQLGVFMVGWEYPPHNSGGLGVACQGMTKALNQLNNHIYFTLPYSVPGGSSHMDILSCVAPSIVGNLVPGQLYSAPFSPYINTAKIPTSSFQLPLDKAKLTTLPQSEIESRVGIYADAVAQEAFSHKNSTDVIHAHDWMSFPAAVAASKATNQPFIAHIHSTEFDRVPNGNGSSFILQTEYEGLMKASRVIAVSAYTKEILVTKYGIPRDKISIVHNGIDPLSANRIPHDSFAPKRPVITFMGRFTMQKGTEFFLELAEKVLARIPDALFIMAGDGDMYHELLWKTASAGLSTSMLFSGFVRDTQRERLLDRSDVFIMPSVSEPFGLVALEAAQRNTPVIVSKNSGVAEVLPSAIQADFWDTDLMADQVVSLLQDTKQSKIVVDNQHRDLRLITWPKAAERINQVYRDVFLGA
ncbi:MAG: hypothetical protein COY80_04135 [Candidatus Pacebacteria bacterium CG_4_10_14_0_8_um_filter_42_14]|nr:MAG: hypothetical protein COY80_04135 [Candidatus Pacebacteria bacterium CG_4_10_14_0_8_um_filter_42_14]